MHPEPERIATVREAAAYAEVSERTVLRWLAAKRITGYRYEVGPHRVKVDLDEIDVLRRPVAS